MSLLEYIASDEPLEEMGEPNIEYEGHVCLTTFNKEDYYDEIGTEKKYCAKIIWNYSDEGARKIIEYIHEYVENTGNIEMWRVWLGYDDNPTLPKKVLCKVKELTIEMIKSFSEYNGEKKYVIYISK